MRTHTTTTGCFSRAPTLLAAFFCTLLISGCDQSNEEESLPAHDVPFSQSDQPQESCRIFVMWRPPVPAGHVDQFDDPGVGAALEAAFADPLSIESRRYTLLAYDGFGLEIEIDPCEVDTRYLYNELSPVFAGVSSIHFEDETSISFGFSFPSDDHFQNLQQANLNFLAWDRKSLGISRSNGSNPTRAGDNGLGRCNIFGTTAPDPSIFTEMTLEDEQTLRTEFFVATLKEVNEGDYDYVPDHFRIAEVFGIAAWGDCNEASQRSADYLDRAIARMEFWPSSTPIIYHLFVSEQVEGMTLEEVESLWHSSDLYPTGLTNIN